MGPGSFEASAGQLDDQRLDHDAKGAEGGVAVTGREDAPDAGAATDAAAVEDATARDAPRLRPPSRAITRSTS